MGCRVSAFHTHFCWSGPLYSLLKLPVCVWTYRLRKTIHSFSRNHVYHFRNIQESYTKRPVPEQQAAFSAVILCMSGLYFAVDTQMAECPAAPVCQTPWLLQKNAQPNCRQTACLPRERQRWPAGTTKPARTALERCERPADTVRTVEAERSANANGDRPR